MYYMKKRLTALLSAFLVMCSLLTMNASAASSTTPTIKITGTCSVPDVVINVVVPSSTKSYLNPSKAAVQLGAIISNAQIVTETGYIENLSEVPVSVSASVTGTIKSGSTMKFATASTRDSESTAKEAFVFFQMKAVDASVEDLSNVEWDSSYIEGQHIMVTTSTKSLTDFITLDKYDPNAEEDTGNRFGAFLLSGDCVILPTDPWTSKDGFSASIAFTFTALPYGTEVE
jgi:hypothetical protein